MKPKLLFVMAASAAITTFCLQKANAQNWLLGGNSVGKDTTLGIKNDHSLKIITNKIERMRITSSGDVGIGIANEPGGLILPPKLAINSATGQDPFQVLINNTPRLRMSQNGGVTIGSAGNPPANGLFVVGNEGIGTAKPSHARLEITGSVGAAVAMFGADKNGVTIEADNPEIGFNFFYNGGPKTIKAGYASVFGMYPGSGDMYIGNFNGNKSTTDFGSITGFQQVVTITQKGNVGIGTSPFYKLDVCGTIRSKEVIVQTGWCDYVFDKDYKLRSLNDVESYINHNKHLPDVPSATEVEEKGVKVAQMDSVLIKKIEELTLYVIDQNKQIQQLQQKVVLLEKNDADKKN